jgi:hypothetical protein
MIRLLGAIGIAALAVLNVVGLVVAIRNLDWKGITLMLFLTVLLTLFAHTLWRGWRIERGVEHGRVVEGWEGEPLTTFIASVMANTVEGRIYIVGTMASELMALLIWLMPATVAIAPNRSSLLAFSFALWPIIAFILYIRFCGPAYKTSWFSVLLMLGVVSVPFYEAYVR